MLTFGASDRLVYESVLGPDSFPTLLFIVWYSCLKIEVLASLYTLSLCANICIGGGRGRRVEAHK